LPRHFAVKGAGHFGVPGSRAGVAHDKKGGQCQAADHQQHAFSQEKAGAKAGLVDQPPQALAHGVKAHHGDKKRQGRWQHDKRFVSQQAKALGQNDAPLGHVGNAHRV
jgi:hypothetical protein